MPYLISKIICFSLVLCFFMGGFSNTKASCYTTVWIVRSSSQGKCPKGSLLLPAECLEPTSKPSKCSCLKPNIIKIPCLTLSPPH